MQFKDIFNYEEIIHTSVKKKKDSGQSLSTMEVIPSQSFASTTNLLVKKKKKDFCNWKSKNKNSFNKKEESRNVEEEMPEK